MKALGNLLLAAVVIYAIAFQLYKNGRDSIASTLAGHDTVEHLMLRLSSGDQEALKDLESGAESGQLLYSLALGTYSAIQGDYHKRDQIIRSELEEANSLESLIILQEFAYLYDTQALAQAIQGSISSDGSIQSATYAAVKDYSFSEIEIQYLLDCYEGLSDTYGRPPKITWRHYLQAGIENMIETKNVCRMSSPAGR